MSQSQSNRNRRDPNHRVLVVRGGEAWLADDPGRRAAGGFELRFDRDADAVKEWLRIWGEKELGLEIREE